ncbi:MAG TPA: malonate decarboxylase subunit alpha [Thermoanaerobaculia bacterium]|jgi:glutaconate CoA-transferase subunit A|nr:malonate decarboxylase subunit alpha [Thermoanaerobaculia bacterium]
MRRARWVDLAEAAASVMDGASLAPGGFMLGRAPMALVFELVRQGRQDLHVVSLPNPLPAEILVAAGAATRVEFLFTAITLDGRVRPMPCLKRAIEGGNLDWAEHDGYRIVQRFRAAAMGLPFLPVPDADASALSRLQPLPQVTDPFTGETVAVERAFHPDVALIHARAADADGNLWIEDPTTDLLVAGAARRVIATAEERVERVPRATIPGFMVDLLVEEPRGAYPTGCLGLYPADAAHLERYLALAEQGREAEYLESVIRASRRQAELAEEAA